MAEERDRQTEARLESGRLETGSNQDSEKKQLATQKETVKEKA